MRKIEYNDIVERLAKYIMDFTESEKIYLGEEDMSKNTVDKNVKKRAKNIQKALSSKKLIRRIVQGNESLESVKYSMGEVFKYYFTSMDKNTNYNYDEFIEKMVDFERNNSNKPLVDQRYYFQAFNGCYEETFKNNSLDDISDLDPKVKEAFELLENEVSKSSYPKGGETCSFLTTDINTLMHYALDYSPERLWYGPLGETPGIPRNSLIKVGETKEEYMLRILESKIVNKNENDKEKILNAGKIVCEAFGTKRPRIAIIPEKNIEDYPANFSGIYNNSTDIAGTVGQLAESENSDWMFTMKSGMNFSSEFGIAVFDKIEGDQFTTVNIPDAFELVQIFAIQRGAKTGDLIDPQSGEIVEKAKNNEKTTEKNNVNENMLAIRKTSFSAMVEKIMNKVKGFFKTANKDNSIANDVSEQVTEKPQKDYTDYGEINLGGTGEMHLCKDEVGQEFLFKPAVRKYTNEPEPFRAEAQVVASKLQEIISPETAVKCENVEINGRQGTIQPKLEVDEEKTYQLEDYFYYDVPLEEKTIRQFMREYVVDYCLANYDGHFRNFVIDKDGNLRGVDKEQSLKHILSPEAKGDLKMDKFSPNQIYGENPPIYGKIFQDIEDKSIPTSVLDEVTKGIDLISKMPKEDYLSLFDTYIEAVTSDENKKAEIRKGISDRFDSLSDIQKMVEENNPKQSLTSLSKLSRLLKDKTNSLFPNKELDMNKGER